MRGPARGAGSSVDDLYAALRSAGGSVAGIRRFLAEYEPETSSLRGLLRLDVPVRFLEYVATTPPWSDDRGVQGGVVLNPRTPRTLAQRLLPSLYWRDLADVALSPRLPVGIRAKAEGVLKERLVEMRLGERITLARMATPGVLALLLAEADSKVLRAALWNPRLREPDLRLAIEGVTASATLFEAASASTRWRESYAVRLALVLQPRAPLGVALAQLTSLLDRDLLRIAETNGLHPLVQISARRLAQRRRDS